MISKGSPASRQPAFAARPRQHRCLVWYPASYPAPPPGAAGTQCWFPVAFRPTGICFLGILFPPGKWAFLAVRLPIRHINGSDPVGVSVFHTRKIRLGLGVLYTPGTAVSTRPQCIYVRRLPPLNGSVPVCPAQPPDPDSLSHEASARIPGQSPHASLPLTCNPRTEQGSSGFPMGFAPDRPRPATHATAGTSHGH